jgi:hypothetical protein
MPRFESGDPSTFQSTVAWALVAQLEVGRDPLGAAHHDLFEGAATP